MLQAERKKEKEKQVRRAKEQKLKQRQQRLATRDPSRIQKQIDALLARPSLPPHEQRHLESLQKDIEDVRRARQKLGHHERGPGRKSYYWDPKLNPEGFPPEGEEQALRSYGSEEEDSGYSTSESVSSIPMPGTRVTQNSSEAKTTYEAEPELRNLTKEVSTMIPATLRRAKKKQKTGPESSTISDTAPEQPGIAPAPSVAPSVASENPIGGLPLPGFDDDEDDDEEEDDMELNDDDFNNEIVIERNLKRKADD